MKRTLLLASLVALALLSWFLWPVYGFYAHRGVVPMPPGGWVALDGPMPATQTALDPRFAERGARALDVMRSYRREANLPSLSAAVAVEGALVWTGAVGFADIASAAPTTADTLFRIGSTSKPLTATALARLVERGEIGLDVPLAEYFEALPNPAWSTITLRQLASHSAGMPHYGENRDWAGLYRTLALDHHYADMRDALDVFDGSPLLHEPGTAFHYSSLGTVLLGATMSEVAGLPYRQLMQREVFAPVDMTSTFPDGDAGTPQARLATPYYTDGERFRPWRPVDVSHRLAGGGLVSTPADLARLGMRWLDVDYLSAATREAFWTPQQLQDGTVNEQDYALGWRWREWDVEGIGVARNANHGGVARGSQCWLIVYPDFVMSMAFCTNAKTEEFGTFGRVYEPLLKAFATPPRSALTAPESP